MRMLIGAFAALFTLVMPGIALANQGILLLAHNGTAEWNAQITDLAAKVDAQKPAEVAFGTPTRAVIAAAADRLAKRGVTGVVAVPFFLASPIPPEHLDGHVVPIRIAPAAARDPLFGEIILSRAQEISDKPDGEVLVVIGFGADDAGTPWVVNLAPSAQWLNRTRRFASILTIARPDRAVEREHQIRLSLERQVAAGSRIVVVPVLSSANGSDTAIERWLQGFAYEVATRGIMSDDRLVHWLAEQASAPVR